MTRPMIWALLLLLSGSVSADIIHYKDGRTLEGVILERSSTEITVETSFGTIDVPLSKIDHIEEKLTLAQELAAQRATIADDDANSLYLLALWAKDNKLRKQHRALLDEVLTADPQHVQANSDLGRVELDGRWFDPEDLEKYLAEIETEMLAQGKIFHDGRWLPEAEVMALRGLALYNGQWLPQREVDVRLDVDELSSLVHWQTSATTGEFVTVYSDLDEDTLEFLIHDLDSAMRDFLRRSRAVDPWQGRLTKRHIPIYMPSEQEQARAMLENGFLAKRYSLLADSAEKWTNRQIFGMNWPQAFLVLVNDGRLEINGDADEARRGYLSHLMGALFIDRYKGTRSCPDWALLGLQTFYEGATNYHSTLTLSSEKVDAEGEPIALWYRGWETFVDWRDNLRDPGIWSTLPTMRQLMTSPKERLDSRDIGMCWSLVSFLLDQHETEFFDYLKAFDSDPLRIIKAADMIDEHDRAYAATFAPDQDELEAQWQNWAMARPQRFPVDILDR
ncbi:MAG: hypothetical protein ACI9EF_003536 [Pseudohongiellaceae bacterium]|jgi:hypothetical protein